MYKYLFSLVFLQLISQITFAHQQQETLSKLVFNAASSELQVSHRIFIHDAEQVLKSLGASDYDILNSKPAQQSLVNYVVQHIGIKLNGTAVNLHLLGYEIEGKYLWVYQTAGFDQLNLAAPQLQVRVENRLFINFFPQQRNTVNIEYQSKVYTLLFDNDTLIAEKTLPSLNNPEVLP